VISTSTRNLTPTQTGSRSPWSITRLWSGLFARTSCGPAMSRAAGGTTRRPRTCSPRAGEDGRRGRPEAALLLRSFNRRSGTSGSAATAYDLQTGKIAPSSSLHEHRSCQSQTTIAGDGERPLLPRGIHSVGVDRLVAKPALTARRSTAFPDQGSARGGLPACDRSAAARERGKGAQGSRPAARTEALLDLIGQRTNASGFRGCQFINAPPNTLPPRTPFHVAVDNIALVRRSPPGRTQDRHPRNTRKPAVPRTLHDGALRRRRTRRPQSRSDRRKEGRPATAHRGSATSHLLRGAAHRRAPVATKN